MNKNYRVNNNKNYIIPYTVINFRISNKFVMSTILDKKKLEFIPKSRYDKLSDVELQNLLSYRRLYNQCIIKQQKIEKDKIRLKKDKEELGEWMSDLTSQKHLIDNLREKYTFSCSVVSLPPRKSGKVYYNLTISRKGNYPKNCSLGSEETIKIHLLEFYKGNSKVRKEIKKDWKTWLKNETNYGNTYLRILDIILKNPAEFKNATINRGVLFPWKSLYY